MGEASASPKGCADVFYDSYRLDYTRRYKYGQNDFIAIFSTLRDKCVTNEKKRLAVKLVVAMIIKDLYIKLGKLPFYR